MPSVRQLRCLLPILGLALWASAAIAAAAEAASYRLDPVHTRVVLAIDHAGFSKAIGTVSGSTGTLWTTGEDWADARVDVSVPLERLDFGDADWNRAVAARGLLDTARHPVARFISTRIEVIDADRAIVHGTLTLRGVTRDVALDAVRNGARRHPLPPFRRTVGFSATTTFSRAAFGVDAWTSMIGDTVELRLEVEATRGRADSDAPDPGEPAESDVRDAVPRDADADAGGASVPPSHSVPVPEPSSIQEPTSMPEPAPVPAAGTPLP